MYTGDSDDVLLMLLTWVEDLSGRRERITGFNIVIDFFSHHRGSKSNLLFLGISWTARLLQMSHVSQIRFPVHAEVR